MFVLSSSSSSLMSCKYICYSAIFFWWCFIVSWKIALRWLFSSAVESNMIHKCCNDFEWNWFFIFILQISHMYIVLTIAFVYYDDRWVHSHFSIGINQVDDKAMRYFYFFFCCYCWCCCCLTMLMFMIKVVVTLNWLCVSDLCVIFLNVHIYLS